MSEKVAPGVVMTSSFLRILKFEDTGLGSGDGLPEL